MTATKLTITIPDDLAERLEPWRDRMNISKVCARAIEAEVRKLSTHFSPGIESRLKIIDERIREDTEQERRLNDHALGQMDGEAYAVERLDYPDFVRYREIWTTPGDKHSFDLPEDASEWLDHLVKSSRIAYVDEYQAGWLEGVNNIWDSFKRGWLEIARLGLAERRSVDG